MTCVAVAVALVLWQLRSGRVPELVLVRAVGASRAELVLRTLRTAVPVSAAGAALGGALEALEGRLGLASTVALGAAAMAAGVLAGCLPALRAGRGRPATALLLLR